VPAGRESGSKGRAAKRFRCEQWRILEFAR
jgi:hypothetical protein